MPINPKSKSPVISYVDLPLKRRMQRIVRSKPRMTLSYQVEQALLAYLPTLEAQIGFKPQPSNQLMP